MESIPSDIRGENNRIEVNVGEKGKIVDSDIVIRGNNNVVIAEEGAWLRNAHFVLESSNNYIHIAKNAKYTGRVFMKITDGNTLRIGPDTSVGNASIICGEGTTVSIGADCMLSFDIEIRSTDSHAILDCATGQRINGAADVTIDDHVWVAAHSTLLKGSHIRANSVVAIRSLVTGDIPEENVVIAGVPAKIVKRGVTWERPLLG